MIEIKVKKSGESFEMDIKGHAFFADKGKDIVCAAISVLIQTLADQLDSVTDSFTIKYDHGQIRSIKAAGKKVTPVLDTILTGLLLTQAQYPEYVSLTVSADNMSV